MEKRQPRVCPKSVNCLGENGQHINTCLDGRGSEGYVGKTPLLPAESLCLAALARHTESRARNPIVDIYESVSFDVDRFLAIPSAVYDEEGGVDTDKTPLKKEILQNIVKMLQDVPRIDRVNVENLNTAMLLKRIGIFMPAFQARAFERPLDSSLISQIHSNLVGYTVSLETMRHARPMHEGYKKQISAHLAECEVMALLTRLGDRRHFPYPALIREESSHIRKEHNHDFYTMPNGKKKPVQIKTSARGKGYDKVAVIQHYDILRVMKQQPERVTGSWTPPRNHQDYEWPSPYIYEQILTGGSIDPLGRLLAEERRDGNRMDRTKRQALDLATSYVLARI